MAGLYTAIKIILKYKKVVLQNRKYILLITVFIKYLNLVFSIVD